MDDADLCSRMERCRMAAGPPGGDRTARVFDQWAADGMDADLEKGHRYSVDTFLDSLDMGEPFSFLDVGCGNGWVVRKMAAHPLCTRAVGIDKSAQMIRRAEQLRRSDIEEYRAVPLERWDAPPFRMAFSMESMYYVESFREGISKVYSLLEPGGIFACGTDYYVENKETAWWGEQLDITMHRLSQSQWEEAFRQAGFRTTSSRIRNRGKTGWQRDHGTLFITGIRP